MGERAVGQKGESRGFSYTSERTCGRKSFRISIIYENDPPDRFEDLLQKVSGVIQRSDTVMGEAIPARVKLELVLPYLATGNSYCSLSHFFRVSKPALLVHP
jgi:hypothetical protein